MDRLLLGEKNPMSCRWVLLQTLAEQKNCTFPLFKSYHQHLARFMEGQPAPCRLVKASIYYHYVSNVPHPNSLLITPAIISG